MKKCKSLFFFVLLFVLAVFPAFSGGQEEKKAAAPVMEKESIRIGAARSLSGPLSVVGDTAFGPIFKMWVDEVNAAGGVFVKEYGKKLPIETIIYDDKSDVGTMTRLMEKLIIEDKVDFIMPPVGTAMLFAAAPIANKHKMVLVGMEGGATKIRELVKDLPYVFSALSFADHYQVPPMAEMCSKLGVKSVAICALGDLHGIEYKSVAIPELEKKGIEIVLKKSIPPGIKDLSPIIKEAKALNVDAFLIFAYPDENILATKQSIGLGFNPKLFLTGPGANFEFYKQIFGPASEGVMSWGAWNPKVSPAHKEFADKLVSLYGEGIMDWWGHNLYYAALQCFQKAIEKAGTLDQDKVREMIANKKFDTILGSTWFDKQHLLAKECHTGEVGQWQKGVFEVIAPTDKSTADPVYPKPEW